MDWGDFRGIDHDILPSFRFTEMPTAIARIFTSEGFVLAADGLSVSNDQQIVTTKLQKIYPARSLALSFYGAARLGVSDDPNSAEVLFDFISEMRREVLATSPNRLQDLQNYIAKVASKVQRKLMLELARRTGPLPSIPSLEMDDYGETILVVLVDGYQSGRPGSVRLRFCHENGDLLKPHLKSRDLVPGHSDFYGVHGISDFLNNHDPLLSRYLRDFQGPHSFSARLATEISFARAYIEACGGPEAAAIDPAKAAAIGGHTHVAVITPSRGFEWAIPPTNQV